MAAVRGAFAMASLHVASGGRLTQGSGVSFVLLLMSGDVVVDPGGSITVAGKGCAAGTGNGKGKGSWYGSGGGYGGAGGASYGVPGGVPYGYVSSNPQAGSGGGNGGSPVTSPGGAGGGSLGLNMSAGTLTVNGSVSADGNDGAGFGGGGSGGSIWIAASALAGDGVISANGGNAASLYAGGGGGGRIIIACDTDSFTGAKAAYGGIGYGTGGPGTIYSTPAEGGPPYSLVVDNGSRVGAASPLDFLPVPIDLIVSGNAAVYPTVPATLQSLRLASGGRIFQTEDKPGIELNVYEDVVIESGCAITADGAAYGLAGPGWGLAGPYYGAGGGYGGRGGDASDPGVLGGMPYGSALKPVDLGSRGGNGMTTFEGGAGGGKIKMTVDGAFTLDGLLSANGLTGGYTGGGGSGGSIWVVADGFSGAGSVSANGGDAASMNAGGGGGGRICLAYTGTSSLSTANASANGGDGYVPGEDGTVVIDQITAPAITDIPNHYAVTGMPYIGPTPEVTNDMTRVTWSLIAGPPGAGFGNGVVSWAHPVTTDSPCTVTIRATNEAGSTDKTWQLTVVDNPELVPDDGIIRMGGAIVTAQFAGYMYVQPASRLWGLRVDSSVYSYAVGDRLTIAGPIETNSDFERCIEASSTTHSGTGSCAPIGVPLRSLGGVSYQYDQSTGAGQIGVKSGVGLNNIGLLVRVWGRVTEIDPEGAWFIIDDGSVPAKCLVPDGVTIDPGWDYVAVTGVSSCEVSSGDVNRVVRVRQSSDIVSYP